VKDTAIEWTDHSWSPWRGCTKVSPGCANCYAETLSKRNPAVLGQWGKGKPRVLAKNWNEPVKWNREHQLNVDASHDGMYDGAAAVLRVKRPTVFPSLCDWLDDEVPVEWLAKFLQLIHATPNLRWLMLTKRPENFRRLVDGQVLAMLEMRKDPDEAELREWLRRWINGQPPANVWVGTSVEDQIRADERIPALLRIPAAGRFLSVEPLLGPVDLAASVKAKEACPRCTPPTDPGCPYCLGTGGVPIFHNGAIHWVIIGGESGHGARPCNVNWIRSLVRQCKDASVPCFVKQVGKACEAGDLNLAPAHVDVDDSTDISWLRLTHPKGGDPAEWPSDLRVREFPEGLR
jgi:protein gp37